MPTDTLRAIAFYLPQYHPIAENNAWWGEGFTEWTNVRKAKPLFPRHHQPHVPERLGYYDLRDPHAREAQADLARQYGIHGFCYYHYWFNGKRLLEAPFNEVLASGNPDFPFCLCWANENWTRRWDGEDREVLLDQQYGHEDDLRHIESLFPAFRDRRYIRVDGKPVFLVYKANLLPDAEHTTQIWREAARKAGIGDLYLVRVENGSGVNQSPAGAGFDAACEFAPHWGSKGENVAGRLELSAEGNGSNPLVYDYDTIMLRMLGRPKPDYKLFRGVFPSWDNSARRNKEPIIFVNSSPEKYAFWLAQIARYTLQHFQGDEQLLFVNAWNEWGEGCHLEPDQKHGLRFLEATRNALTLAQHAHEAMSTVRESDGRLPFSPDNWYSIVEETCRNSNAFTPADKNLLGAFAPFALYTMLPMLEPSTLNQFHTIIKEKDDKIQELYDSLSWKITAPLRKLFDLVFK